MDDPTLKDIIRKIALGKFILSTCRNSIYRQLKIISIKSFDTINQHNPASKPKPGSADEVMIPSKNKQKGHSKEILLYVR